MGTLDSWPVRRQRTLAALVVLSPALLVIAFAVDRDRRRDLDLGAMGELGDGRIERCLACHQAEAAALAPAHRPPAVGCSDCHFGNPLSFAKERAHHELERFPGDLASAHQSCGRAPCHPDPVARVDRSLMTTMRGIVAVNRFAFGESEHPDNGDRIANLATHTAASPADAHLRKLCASCHLGTSHRGADRRARGGGCAACHLRPSESSTRHPQLRVGMSAAPCTGCHSRSGRIALSYYGWHEGAVDDPTLSVAPTGRRTLDDGRRVERSHADVHADAAMTCLDCHTSIGLMGDGREYSHEEDQVDIACTDCHERAGPARTSVIASAETAALRILRLLATAPPVVAGDRVARTERGTVISGVRPAASGSWALARRTDGLSLAIPNLPDDRAHGDLHARLTCQACHTRWSHQCNSCHTSYDAAGEQWDNLDGRTTRGRWLETPGPVLIAPPTLGVDADDRVRPFVPGMPMCVEDGASPRRCVRLFAQSDPHTTGKSRTCASCHQSSLAVGLGRGRVTISAGAWRFVPTPLPHSDGLLPAWPDGVPWDGWTSLAGPGLAAATRTGAHPLGASEIAAVLEVGRCTPCHDDYDDVIFADFAASQQRLSIGRAKRCTFSSTSQK